MHDFAAAYHHTGDMHGWLPSPVSSSGNWSKQVNFPKRIYPLAGALLALAITPAKAAVVETFDWTLTGPSASLGGVPDPASLDFHGDGFR